MKATRIGALVGLALGALVAGVGVIAYNSAVLVEGRAVTATAALVIMAAGALAGTWAGYWAAGGHPFTPEGYERPTREPVGRPRSGWLP